MKRIITFGEIMMRLSPPTNERFGQARHLEVVYGGSEANVSLALAQWGWPCAHVSALPDHAFGQAVGQYLRQHGVDTQYLCYTNGRLGLYFLEKGAALRGSQVIYDRYHSALAQIEKYSFDWENILHQAQWFHWTGITPALSENCAYELRRAMAIAQKLGVPVSGDVYFRSGLWQYGASPQEVLPELIALSQVVVCDEKAMQAYFGLAPEVCRASFAEAAQNLMAQFPSLQKVLDTQRVSLSATCNRISARMWNGNTYLETLPLEINPIIDRVGAGDAFMAGFLHATLSGQSDAEALHFGICASAWKHTIPGDMLLASVEEIKSLQAGDTSGTLKR
ncbi:MAG: sugar kinase [Microscillaceae bacterium]|nr:sugar kinase [Microscillaceae bacterium]